MSYCDRWMSVVNNYFKGHLNEWLDLDQTWQEWSLYGPLYIVIIVQMVPVRCISRSYRLKIDFRDENFKNLLV